MDPPVSTRAAWNFWIDRGGTFTDVIGESPAGRLVLRKVPSSTRGESGDPGIAAALSILRDAGASPDDLGTVRVGTTVVTNALLERRGSKLLLVVTRGFGDAIVIGHQARPDIFALQVERALPLHADVLEVDERVACDGQVIEPLDEVAAAQGLEAARQKGFEAVAIVLLHGWRHVGHEQRLAQLAAAAGFAEIVTSHQCLPLPRFVPRAESSAFDAYLAVCLKDYVRTLERELLTAAPAARLEFMQSSGGLCNPQAFRALTSVLSGPAGGLIGMAAVGQRSTGDGARLIGFDMGGTSTDVSIFDRAFARRFEHEIEGIRLSAPMLDVHTIAAGGGSLLAVRDGRYRVGPRSAGADPGPACYGRGGPATLTDVQVALGHLHAAFMPALFGPQRDAVIDIEAARGALRTVLQDAGHVLKDQGEQADNALADAACGFLDVAVAAMANAIRHVSVRQGIDPADFTLVAFGGAAGQHACRVAAAAGMRRVLVHPLASVLSAYGIGIADRIAVRREGLALPLDEPGIVASRHLAAKLIAAAQSELATSPTELAAMQIEVILELREGDAETSLDVTCHDLSIDSIARLQNGFRAAHQQRFGFAAGEALQIVAVRVEARLPGATTAHAIDDALAPLRLPTTVRAWFDGWQEVPVRDATTLGADPPLQGPALVVEPRSTFVLEHGWQLARDPSGAWIATQLADVGSAAARSIDDPAQIEIFDGLFMHAATQMGEVLRRTAQSVNIKERLDYSCALFDAGGGLVANAPHMPVHLGSMGATVAALLRERAAEIRDGDAWLINAPSQGGTHLPDMTVVSPVFFDDSRPAFFVASRAHHADIGGITPGSMPPFSTALAEEGAVFRGMLILRDGVLRNDEVSAAFTSGRFPARNPLQNLADLRAQLAANQCGIEELRRAVGRHGVQRLARAMSAVQDNAARCVENAIRRLGNRDARCTLALDGGQRIVVHVKLDAPAGRGTIDFSGTSPAGPHNFNAPRAVTQAAVLYVFRTLVNEPIPLNAGCLRPLAIHVPTGCLLDPPDGHAVVAGNVETSQLIVDALYQALGVLAGAQGTMNNLTFGNEFLQYYETIAGGSGAGRSPAATGFAGCAAVQTHMTNSRLTDAEILEARYPVRLRRFAIRRDSGGKGQWRGGDGALREIEFLQPLTGAMLANRRSTRAPGLDGGGEGAAGVTRIRRRDGRIEEFPACARFELEVGDILEVATPGGGGCGAP
jgi:5-oxoprolinase (ATP-hydrolysing)